MKWSAVPLLLLLAACQVLEDTGEARADRFPTGTLLDLHRDLTIPPGQAGVYNPGHPHRRPTVRADRFIVERVRQQWERFSQREIGLRRVRLFDRDDPALLRCSTVLSLRADRQPDGSRRVCSHLRDSVRQPRQQPATWFSARPLSDGNHWEAERGPWINRRSGTGSVP